MNRMIDDLYATMPWDEIDAVVFDVGNVLLSWDPPAILRRILPDRQDLYPILMERIFQTPYWTAIDHNTMTLPDITEAMIGGREDLRAPITAVMQGWIDLPEIPEGVEAIRTCKAHGKRLYVLSNYGDAPFAHAQATHSFFTLFDRLFVSSRVGMIKPDPDIYTHVIAETGEDPSRVLFLDDSIPNIYACLNAGWQGLLVRSPERLAAFMR